MKGRFHGVWGFLARMTILALVVGTCSQVMSPFDDLKFDPTVWRQYSGYSDPRSPRGRMYEDLRRRLLRDRPTREAVLEMLGEPDAAPEDPSLEYALGAWSGFRMDFDTMFVTFDESGRVSGVYRLQG